MPKIPVLALLAAFFIEFTTETLAAQHDEPWRGSCEEQLDESRECSVGALLLGTRDVPTRGRGGSVEFETHGNMELSLWFDMEDKDIVLLSDSHLFPNMAGDQLSNLSLIFDVDGKSQIFHVEKWCVTGATGTVLLCTIDDSRMFDVLISAFRKGREVALKVVAMTGGKLGGLADFSFSLMGFTNAHNAAR